MRQNLHQTIDITNKNVQIETLSNVYKTYMLPHIIKIRISKKLQILLAACGEYMGAIDAFCCLQVFSSVHIRAFDKYIDMHTKELYENLVNTIELKQSAHAEFFNGDVYDITNLLFPNNSLADIVIIRNLSPELNNFRVMNNLIESVATNGLLVVTALSQKEALTIKKTLNKEFERSHPRIYLKVAQPISIQGFLINDEYIFVYEKL